MLLLTYIFKYIEYNYDMLSFSIYCEFFSESFTYYCFFYLFLTLLKEYLGFMRKKVLFLRNIYKKFL